ncbi:DNA primase family protein [Candidatus Microthrix parvicella]|nr:phage/plasmid primase, P4 family [Candidatus Microthrix parvicella]
MTELFLLHNGLRKVMDYPMLPSLHTLAPVQAAILLDATFSIRQVVPSGTSADDALGPLAIYQTEGGWEGTYRRTDVGLLEGLAGRMRPTGDGRWHDEVERHLRRIVPKAEELDDSEMVPLANCWLNYRTGERLPFGPDRVTLAKMATDLPDALPPVPEIANADGTTWNAWEWFCSVFPDEGVRLFALQVIGMCLRPGVDWRVIVYFVGDGLNGKGTFLELVRFIVGLHVVTSIPPSKFGERFALGAAIGKRLNLVDEDDVGKFIENAAALKLVTSRDPLLIERKHRDPVTARLLMSTLVSLNEFPKMRDKTQAMLDRQVFIEMSGRFVGTAKNEAIKDDFVRRREVCEFFVYLALVETPKYWRLSVPEAAEQTKAAFRSDSDKIVAYWEEFGPQFSRDFLPFDLLYKHFVAWRRANSPSGTPEDSRSFTRRLKKLVDAEEWMVPQSSAGADKELTLAQWLLCPEPVLAEYAHLPDVSNWDWDGRAHGGGGEVTKWMRDKRKARGFVRREVWEAHSTAATTPYQARRGG